MPTRGAGMKALARAFRYQRLLDEARYASISEMEAAERIERGYLGGLLRLTLLAPDVVEANLDGRQTDGPEMRRVLVLEPIPADRSGHRQALRGAAQRIQRGRAASRRSYASEGPPEGARAVIRPRVPGVRADDWREVAANLPSPPPTTVRGGSHPPDQPTPPAAEERPP